MEEEIKLRDLGVRHFSRIFKDDLKTNIFDQLKVIKLFSAFLSEEETGIFSSMISLGEVEVALKSFKKDKSPGPDGWPVEFFLGFFDIVGVIFLLLLNLLGSLEGWPVP